MEHSCQYYHGRIKDVCFIVNEKLITCHRCGKTLQEEEIDPSTYLQIKYRFDQVKK